MKKLVSMFVVSLVMLCVGTVSAQDMYAAIFGGYGFESFDQDAAWMEIGADPDNIKGSWIIGCLVGYNISEALAFEASFEWIDAFKPDESVLDKYKLKHWNIMASAKYKFGMESAWTPYAIGGVGFGQFTGKGGLYFPEDGDAFKVKDEEQGFFFRVGGGIDYDLEESGAYIFTDVGYNITMGDIENWNFWDWRIGVGMGF